MSVKTERLNDQFQEVISEIIFKEVKDPELKLITITGCSITNDLSICKVYYTSLSNNLDEVKKALKSASSFIRGEISKRVEIRHTPELKFVYDQSIAYGEKIDKIIEKINKNEK